MDSVLLGESLPESLSLLDKGIPPSSSGSIDCGTTSLVRDVWSREFRERRREGVQNLQLDGLLTLIAITHGNLGGLIGEADTLSRADEREGEEIRHEENHGPVE